MANSSSWFSKLLLVLLLTPVGCGGGRSVPTTFYMLTSSPQVAITGGEVDRISVLVGPVVTSGYLDRDQIVTFGQGSRVVVDDLSQWAEPLATNIKQVFVENLSVLLNTARVYDVDSGAPDLYDYQLRLNINKFHVNELGKAVLISYWSVHDATGTQRLREKTKIEKNISDPGTDNNVAGLNEILETFSREVAQTILTLSNG